jgi:hypothetical protein
MKPLCYYCIGARQLAEKKLKKKSKNKNKKGFMSKGK